MSLFFFCAEIDAVLIKVNKRKNNFRIKYILWNGCKTI